MSDEFDDEHTDSLDKTSVVPSETFKVRLAQAGQAPPCLVLLVGPPSFVGRQWPIEKTDSILGRSESAQVYIDERSLSKSHAKFILAGGEVQIIDLESTNKTVVNGQVIPSLIPQKLKNNDQIKTGNIIFKFLEKGNIETVSVAETFDRGLTDALTGIGNRAAFESTADENFRKSELLGVPFSLITFDIDHFKNTNDTFGHPAGDYVLKELAKVIRDKLIRGNDFFARTGGEEFSVILLGSPVEKAAEIGERIRQTIESHHFEFNSTVIPVTISVGVASNTEDSREWQQVFERADKALYLSKNSGRNKVSVDKK